MQAAAAVRKSEPFDEVTLRRAQRGDPRAWRDLVERFQRPVHALIWRLLAGRAQHRAEDLTQETFVRVLRALPKFDPAGPASLSTWIVYEGHVKAGRGAQPTVVVAPGSTYQIENQARPVVGGSLVTVPREEPSAEDERTEATDPAEPDALEDPPKQEEPPSRQVPSGLDRAAIQRAMAKLRSALSACGDHGVGKVVANVRVAPSGKVTSVTATSDNAALAACVEPIVATARFPATENGGSFSYPFVF